MTDVLADPEPPAFIAALAADAAGLCVLPPREDGSKAPGVPSWRRYQAQRPTAVQLRTWYAKGRSGVGLVCGNVSGGLEMLELEGRAVHEGVGAIFRELCVAAGLGEVLTRIKMGYTERTPSGGVHILYRVPTPRRNTKLARRQATLGELALNPNESVMVLIETRGEGGYVITAPSNGSIHPNGGAWHLERGGFESIESISDEERDEIWRIAASLDQMPVDPLRSINHTGSDRPGDRYNARPNVQGLTVELLERHGWTHVYARGGIDFLRRPGKNIGVSATVGYAGPGVVHVFSSSVAALEPNRSHAPFTVLTQLDYGGDPSAAAADLEPTASPISIGASDTAREGTETESAPPAWPEPPGDAAYRSVAGELVRVMSPHTEADPVALLLTILTAFGALAGDNRNFYLGQQQRPNLFTVLVGDTSTGRKGTALSVIREIFTAAHSDWDGIVVPGLGSGEGLVAHLRRNEQKGERRAFVLESEFGRLLRVMAREGSTLSPILRDAWDGVPLGRILARDSAIVVRHHVACLAHITPVELHDKLRDVDAANGFGNRFLFVAVRRFRLVPFPRSPRELVEDDIIEDLRATIAWAQTPGEMFFTAAAGDRWANLYEALSHQQAPGLVGAITRRAEAQMARLALVYALLDRSGVVDIGHLEAAEALWAYAARSARYVFGESTGNRHADVVLRLLRADGELDRQTIKQETGLRLGADLDAIENVLIDAGLAVQFAVARIGGGRARRVLRLAANAANGRNGHEGAKRDGEATAA